ncbi:unnamed protein product, partial [Amoebophrya sp. A25]
KITELQTQLTNLKKERAAEKDASEAALYESATKCGTLEDKLTKAEMEMIKVRGETDQLREELKMVAKAHQNEVEGLQDMHMHEKQEKHEEFMDSSRSHAAEVARLQEQVIGLRADLHKSETTQRQLLQKAHEEEKIRNEEQEAANRKQKEESSERAAS